MVDIPRKRPSEPAKKWRPTFRISEFVAGLSITMASANSGMLFVLVLEGGVDVAPFALWMSVIGAFAGFAMLWVLWDQRSALLRARKNELHNHRADDVA